MATVPYNRTPAQVLFSDDVTTTWLMLNGGVGSGKSYAIVRKLIHLSYLNRGYAGGLLVPSLADYKKDVLPLFMDVIAEHIPRTKYHASDYYFTFPWSRKPLYILSAEKSLRGPNLGYGGVNEHSLIKYEQITELIQRVRVEGAPNPQIAFVGTPDDVWLWLDKFIDEHTETGRLKLVEAKTTDNPHLLPEYVENLKASLDPQAYALFVEGKRVRLTGDYFYYAYDPEVNDYDYVPDLDTMQGDIMANLDFNVGRMSATFCEIIGAGARKQVAFFDEIVLTNYGSDTYALGTAIKQRYGVERLTLTVDASAKARKTSGKTDVQILQSMGFRVRFKSVNPRMRKRQIMVNGLFSKRKILINAEKCPILKRDLLRVEQDRRTFEKVKTNPELTHTSDTLDYLIDWEFTFFADTAARFSAHKRF